MFGRLFGWREYVAAGNFYWLKMPDYAADEFFSKLQT